MSIYKKLNVIQSELKAPKGQMNKFGGYKYRNCEDILEAVKPLLNQHGCVICLSDEVVTVGERVYIKATASIIDVETESAYCNTAYAREEETKKGMDASQITGAASSYARKYALNGLLAIDDTKDSDTTNTHGKEGEKPQEQVVICDSCGGPVMGQLGKDGVFRTPQEVKDSLKGICPACYKASKAV